MSVIKKILCFVTLLICFPVYAQAPLPEEEKSAHILSLADIHFDPFVSCQAHYPCPIIMRLRAAPISEWRTILSKSEPAISLAKQDSDYFLIASALSAAHNVATIMPPSFVLILGDFLGHDYRHYYKKYSGDKSNSGYQSFVYKTLTFLTSEIARTFPSTSVYAVVGNNDSYNGDYVTAEKSRFFSDMAESWSSLIKDPDTRTSMRQQFTNAGYYALTLPNVSGLRLVVMNTVPFSYKARGKNVDDVAKTELEWLHNQLQLAKDNHQRVIIAMHIPDSIDVYASVHIRLFTLMQLWQGEYKARFNAELQQYPSEIMGIFAGHLHTDWMRLLTIQSAEIPVTGTPAISPIFGNLPGFKLYAFSPSTLQLTDFITYYYSLNDKRTWGAEYYSNLLYKSSCFNCPIPKVDKWYPYYECTLQSNPALPHDKACGVINPVS